MDLGEEMKKNINFPSKVLFGIFLYGGIYFCITGCGFLPWYTNENVVLKPPTELKSTRAQWELNTEDLHKNTFVGVALSGGGNRGSNFGAAALYELEHLGLLPDKITVVSGVSGGAVPAAYYGLFASKNLFRNKEYFKEILRKDLETSFLIRGLMPWNFLRVWFTDFDRGNILNNVLNDVFFDNKKYLHMPPELSRPRIFINSTQIGTNGTKFVFTDENFKNIESDLSSLPVSIAVTASEAFPAIIHPVTIKNYSNSHNSQEIQPDYYHLYDGGTSDNLAVETLKESVIDLFNANEKIGKSSSPKCFLFVIDSRIYLDEWGHKKTQERDPRDFVDNFIDLNFIGSIDAFMNKAHAATLKEIGIMDSLNKPFGHFEISRTSNGTPIACGVLHINYQRLQALATNARSRSEREKAEKLKSLYETVNSIPTRYKLIGPENMEEKKVQETLFEAAKVLFREDQEALRFVCSWFNERSIWLNGCQTFSENLSN